MKNRVCLETGDRLAGAMHCPSFLESVVKSTVEIHSIADDIWSVVEESHSNQVYDNHAALYDKLIGSKLYNRVAWGTSPLSYSSFAEQASLFGDGILLDGGCGSLISTADMHVNSGRNTILCDLSEGMLLAARDRIIAIAGKVPEHLVLLQADIRFLPFLDRSFGAILCPGMLHIFDDVLAVTRELSRVASPEAQLFMSSLVAERWISKRYLDLLYRAEEIALPRNKHQLQTLLDSSGSGLQVPINTRLDGSVMFVTARPSDA